MNQLSMARAQSATGLPTLRALLQLSAGRQMATLFLLTLLASLTEGAGLLMVLPVLERLQQSAGHAAAGWSRVWIEALSTIGWPTTVPGLLAACLLVVLVRAGVQMLREQRAAQWQHNVVDTLRQQCFAALLSARWDWLAKRRQADDESLLLTDLGRVGVALHHLVGLAASGVSLAACLVVALGLSWPITLLAAGSGLMMLALMAGHRRAAMRLGTQLSSMHQALHRTVHDQLSGLKTTKMLGQQTTMLNEVDLTLSRLRQEQERFIASSSRARAIFQVIAAALLLGYVQAGLTWWPTPWPTLITLVLVFARMLPLLGQAQQQWQQMLHALPVAANAQKLLHEARLAAEPARPTGPLDWPWRREITLSQVTVQHADRPRPALDAVNLKLPVNTTTVVLGPSGAGKSTMADVLAGLRIPEAGYLCVDGQPVRGAGVHRWRASVAYVTQEVVLRHATVRDNLRWARPDANDAALWTALRDAAAEVFVRALPHQLDTIVGDQGHWLSGGERQRLALARALLRQPRLLILDEATSALDIDHEQQVRAAIARLRGRLTVLVITHRRSMLDTADQVVVIDAGRIQTPNGPRPPASHT